MDIGIDFKCFFNKINMLMSKQEIDVYTNTNITYKLMSTQETFRLHTLMSKQIAFT